MCAATHTLPQKSMSLKHQFKAQVIQKKHPGYFIWISRKASVFLQVRKIWIYFAFNSIMGKSPRKTCGQLLDINSAIKTIIPLAHKRGEEENKVVEEE